MKKFQKISVLSFLLILSMILVSCSNNSKIQSASTKNGKSISVNTLKNEMTFTNVDFYDFYNYQSIRGYSEKDVAILSGYHTTEIMIADLEGDKVMCVSTSLASVSESVDVYKNYLKTDYDTYYTK